MSMFLTGLVWGLVSQMPQIVDIINIVFGTDQIDPDVMLLLPGF